MNAEYFGCGVKSVLLVLDVSGNCAKIGNCEPESFAKPFELADHLGIIKIEPGKRLSFTLKKDHFSNTYAARYGKSRQPTLYIL